MSPVSQLPEALASINLMNGLALTKLQLGSYGQMWHSLMLIHTYTYVPFFAAQFTGVKLGETI